MEIISKSVFSELANHRSRCAISVYIPTHKAGVEVNEQQDIIVFKNALQQIRKMLQGRGMTNDQIDPILKPGFELLEHDTFWYTLSHGLAVFIADGFFRTVKLPSRVKEEILINNTFYVSPLVPVMSNNKHFFLLVFSKQSAKLYRGDAYELQKVEVEELPEGMEDVFNFDDKAGRQLFRGGGTSPGAGANWHGHGSGLADDKAYISEYLKEVDQVLWTNVLSTEKAPLVLSAVDYMIPFYKHVSRYKHICEKGIVGNYEHEDLNTLLAKALEIVSPYFQEEDRKALETFYNQSNTGLTSTSPDEIIPASHFGRISDLFVMKDAHIWGKFDENENHLEIHDDRQEQDDCLINQAVVKTVANGGAVHVLEPERMPNGSKITAFMRYEIAS